MKTNKKIFLSLAFLLLSSSNIFASTSEQDKVKENYKKNKLSFMAYSKPVIEQSKHCKVSSTSPIPASLEFFYMGNVHFYMGEQAITSKYKEVLTELNNDASAKKCDVQLQPYYKTKSALLAEVARLNEEKGMINEVKEIFQTAYNLASFEEQSRNLEINWGYELVNRGVDAARSIPDARTDEQLINNYHLSYVANSFTQAGELAMFLGTKKFIANCGKYSFKESTDYFKHELGWKRVLFDEGLRELKSKSLGIGDSAKLGSQSEEYVKQNYELREKYFHQMSITPLNRKGFYAKHLNRATALISDVEKVKAHVLKEAGQMSEIIKTLEEKFGQCGYDASGIIAKLENSGNVAKLVTTVLESDQSNEETEANETSVVKDLDNDLLTKDEFDEIRKKFFSTVTLNVDQIVSKLGVEGDTQCSFYTKGDLRLKRRTNQRDFTANGDGGCQKVCKEIYEQRKGLQPKGAPYGVTCSSRQNGKRVFRSENFPDKTISCEVNNKYGKYGSDKNKKFNVYSKEECLKETYEAYRDKRLPGQRKNVFHNLIAVNGKNIYEYESRGACKVRADGWPINSLKSRRKKTIRSCEEQCNKVHSNLQDRYGAGDVKCYFEGQQLAKLEAEGEKKKCEVIDLETGKEVEKHNLYGVSALDCGVKAKYYSPSGGGHFRIGLDGKIGREKYNGGSCIRKLKTSKFGKFERNGATTNLRLDTGEAKCRSYCDTTNVKNSYDEYEFQCFWRNKLLFSEKGTGSNIRSKKSWDITGNVGSKSYRSSSVNLSKGDKVVQLVSPEFKFPSKPNRVSVVSYISVDKSITSQSLEVKVKYEDGSSETKTFSEIKGAKYIEGTKKITGAIVTYKALNGAGKVFVSAINVRPAVVSTAKKEYARTACVNDTCIGERKTIYPIANYKIGKSIDKPMTCKGRYKIKVDYDKFEYTCSTGWE